MSDQYTKLKLLLKELFQLDQPELDFGFYRVMHAKANEVTHFLDEELLPQVKHEFSRYESADKAEIEKELDKVLADLEAAEADPESSGKVKALKQKLADEAVDIDGLEAEVYDHLFRFFRRYYSEGDFLSKRVYKNGVYAIPYQGEELNFYWANQDQFYIKTSEYLRDYAFCLRPGAEDPRRVHFRLRDAAEGEHGNVKPAEGAQRVFVLADADPVAEEDGELVVRFDYRQPVMADWPGDTGVAKKKPPSQKELISFAAEAIAATPGGGLATWLTELSQAHKTANGEETGHSVLEAQLRRYTARNTFDYFIHKDLGSFLRRELDFYVKNELMRLDDIESESAARVEQYLSKIKVVRGIARKIIDFLAQLESFQKKLWLKRKFVVETSYCISLDQIPEELYPEIAANQAQHDEWVRLFAIDGLAGTNGEAGYSNPLTAEFLASHQGLLLDTALFDEGFVARLLGALDDLDGDTDGLLVHGDNFQALNLLGKRYAGEVRCIYIDPPYNTESSSIPYKNNYRHSSWATMMNDRLAALRPVLTDDGAIFVSIDKAERTVLQHTMDDVFGSANRVEELIWSMNTNNSQAPNYSTNHEYVLVYARDRSVAEQDPKMFREPKPGYEEVMALVAELNPEYPRIDEIEAALKDLYDGHKVEFRAGVEAQGLEWRTEKKNDPWKGLYNYSHAEYRDADGRLVPEAEAESCAARIWVWQEGDLSMPATKQASSTKDPDDPNWRFFEPIHPVTDKPSPRPKSGWKLPLGGDGDPPEKRSFRSLDRDDRIAWGPDEKKVPRLKRMLHEVETNIGKSVFQDYSDGEKQTSAMFGRSGVFLAPKHANFVSRFILQAGGDTITTLDCFGGSGTTAHAVIKLNREDGGQRKYVIVEMGDYFDTVLKPRVLKAAYSSEWRSGKPLSRHGISQRIKILRLESYEDSLNNLTMDRSEEQQNLLSDPAAGGPDGLKEEFMLRYMLDVDTRGSASLLDIDAFARPTSYKLRVKRPGSEESRNLHVDLLETFNWLLGLTVVHVTPPQHVAAEFDRDQEKRLRLKGELEISTDAPWSFRTVKGTTPDGRRTLVIWRSQTGDPERDNLVLDAWFERQGYSSEHTEVEVIYVNGDSNLENLKAPEERWKVRLIEEEFHRLMFDTSDG